MEATELLRDPRSDWDERDGWTCYRVLHSGEGPCVSPEVIRARQRPREAAVSFAMQMAAKERRIGGVVQDGDEWHVAVETEPGYALFFCVDVRVRKTFVARLCYPDQE